MPSFAVEHAKTTARGLEIWMCTLGAGIITDRRDDVRLIWSLLASSTKHLRPAIQQLYAFERETAEMTGSPSGMFDGLKDEDWLDLCRFVPSTFAKELHAV
jgi:hypothetical protein